jgi:hypothetical protein
MTAWIGEYGLLAAGVLVQLTVALLLYSVIGVRLASPERGAVGGPFRAWRAGVDPRYLRGTDSR